MASSAVNSGMANYSTYEAESSDEECLASLKRKSEEISQLTNNENGNSNNSQSNIEVKMEKFQGNDDVTANYNYAVNCLILFTNMFCGVILKNIFA